MVLLNLHSTCETWICHEIHMGLRKTFRRLTAHSENLEWGQSPGSASMIEDPYVATYKTGLCKWESH